MPPVKSTATASRYARQVALPVIGEAGQERLRSSTAVVVGCGGLGGLAAELLVRAGLGSVRIVDADTVSLVNLHRQLLFDEEDARRGRGKAEAAAARLRRCNSEVRIEAFPERLGPKNALRLLEGSQVVVDATDNLESRYVLNDACLELSLPWVYGGAVGTSGMVATFGLAGGPCLRCVFSEPAPEGLRPNAATSGVWNALPSLVASLQVTAATRVLLGSASPEEGLLVCELWEGELRRLTVQPDEGCPACRLGRRDYLRPDQGAARQGGEP